ncbi:hypothetical protein BS78_10G178700 [Paspalum vaginatum]|nr:hypothetical protein BS78_10G178700 [Paspalum vaginatum]
MTRASGAACPLAWGYCRRRFSDCPGTHLEEAGKADAYAGCHNQQLCATAPKGPDPSNWIIHALLLNFNIPFNFIRLPLVLAYHYISYHLV